MMDFFTHIFYLVCLVYGIRELVHAISPGETIKNRLWLKKYFEKLTESDSTDAKVEGCLRAIVPIGNLIIHVLGLITVQWPLFVAIWIVSIALVPFKRLKLGVAIDGSISAVILIFSAINHFQLGLSNEQIFGWTGLF